MDHTMQELENLHNKALSAGWTMTCERAGIRYYRTPKGRKARMDMTAGLVTTQFWLLVNS